jgi:protein-tyrosine phosphatase
VGRHRQVEQSFRVLVVCTANMCRSPTAEIMLRAALHDRLGPLAAGFIVSSAGVAVPPQRRSMHPLTRAELRARGLSSPAEAFVVTQLQTEHVTRADLVLGAERRHCAAVVEQTPEALPVTFGLREFARLAAAVDASTLSRSPVVRAHELVELARVHRGLVTARDRGSEDVPDPVGGTRDDHRRAADAIGAATWSIVQSITPNRR